MYQRVSFYELPWSLSRGEARAIVHAVLTRRVRLARHVVVKWRAYSWALRSLLFLPVLCRPAQLSCWRIFQARSVALEVKDHPSLLLLL